VSGDQPQRIPNLGYVACDLWAKVVYDFFIIGNTLTNPDRQKAEFDSGDYALRLMTQSKKALRAFPSISLDLKPLLSWNVSTALPLVMPLSKNTISYGL
jgi:hypothetical protein